jgi:hypothetical protein
MWKEAVETYFDALSRHLPGETKERFVRCVTALIRQRTITSAVLYLGTSSLSRFLAGDE